MAEGLILPKKIYQKQYYLHNRVKNFQNTAAAMSKNRNSLALYKKKLEQNTLDKLLQMKEVFRKNEESMSDAFGYFNPEAMIKDFNSLYKQEDVIGDMESGFIKEVNNLGTYDLGRDASKYDSNYEKVIANELREISALKNSIDRIFDTVGGSRTFYKNELDALEQKVLKHSKNISYNKDTFKSERGGIKRRVGIVFETVAASATRKVLQNSLGLLETRGPEIAEQLAIELIGFGSKNKKAGNLTNADVITSLDGVTYGFDVKTNRTYYGNRRVYNLNDILHAYGEVADDTYFETAYLLANGAISNVLRSQDSIRNTLTQLRQCAAIIALNRSIVGKEWKLDHMADNAYIKETIIITPNGMSLMSDLVVAAIDQLKGKKLSTFAQSS